MKQPCVFKESEGTPWLFVGESMYPVVRMGRKDHFHISIRQGLFEFHPKETPFGYTKILFVSYIHISISIKKEKPWVIFKAALEGGIAREVKEAGGTQVDTATSLSRWQTGDTMLSWLRKTMDERKQCLLVMELFSTH